MKKIGFIGVGVMGKPMVRHLFQAGFEVTIYTRTKDKVNDLIEEGLIWKDSVKECVKDQNIIMTMVGYPHDVEAVYYQDGILDHAKKHAILIDFTTSSPKLAQRIYEDSLKKDLYSIDAPVSGGDIGAQNATLSIMAGGDQDIYEKVKPIFDILGHSHYVGHAGLGQHTKMANQIVIAGTIAGVSEAIYYAQKTDLDPQLLLDCISTGAAGSWQLEHNGQAMIDKHFEPGFYIKHFIKDMKIADHEVNGLQVLNQVLKMYEALDEDESGTQALIHYYKKN